MEAHLILILVILFNINCALADTKYKICAKKKFEGSECYQIRKLGKIGCVVVDNEEDCLTKLEKGEVDFANVEAETAFLGGKLLKNIVVVATTKPETDLDYYKYQTVIVSKEKSTLETLKGMTYCHPGFHNKEVPPLILKEFEQHIFKKKIGNDCKNMTVDEYEICMLNDYFGPSCRPGEWTEDKELNNELDKKYPKLIELCSNLENTFFDNSLNCMLNNTNSFSLTTLDTINTRQQLPPLYYYCKNGTVSNEPCVWSKQPHQFLIINKNKIGDLDKKLMIWLSANSEPHNKPDDSNIYLEQKEKDYIDVILNVVHDNTRMRFSFVELPSSLEKFIDESRTIPKGEDVTYGRKMKWCTISDEEQTKCEWLSQASINYGIQPVVECIKKSNSFECIHGIKEKQADLVRISTDLGYDAFKNGLSAVAFPEIFNDKPIKTLLLVKNETITKLEDLKDKKGCFPSYGGIPWVSFIASTKEKMENNSCNYEESIKNFLGDSCIPGFMEPNTETTDVTKMCKLCTDSGNTCEANEENNYFNTKGALKCLEDAGDFAVVVKNDFKDLNNNYQVMCKNETLTTLDRIDENCFLSVVTTSVIVTRNDSLKKDIELALLKYDKWFGDNTHAPFKLFDSFDGTKDLLFKDGTLGFNLPNSDKTATKNYVEVFEHIKNCSSASPSGLSTNGTAPPKTTAIITIVVSIVVTLASILQSP